MPTTRCPICGAGLVDLRLDDANVLDRCPHCDHLVRDLERCPAGARATVYGGDEGLDAVRLRLTERRLRSITPSAGRIFELGYGSGALLARLARAGYTVAGIDSGQAGIGRPAPAGVPAGALRHGTASAAVRHDGEQPYDAVLGVHVIEHVPDPLEVLRAAHGLLRPGGTLALVTPSADSLGLVWFGADWWMLEDPTHVAFFSPASVRRALAGAGFTDVQVRRPLLESVTCEAASVRRRQRTARRGDGGALAARRTLALAAATLPVDLALRALRPRLRPALFVTARRRAGVM